MTTLLDTTLLDAVDWHDAFADLVARAPSPALAAGASAAVRSALKDEAAPLDPAALLAWIVHHLADVRRYEITAAVQAASELTEDDAAVVALWLARTATAYIAVCEPPTVDAAPAPVRPPGEFSIADELAAADLPLIDLARQLAQTLPTGLRIEIADLPPGRRGDWQPHAGLIRLDNRQAPDRTALARTFAHELAHALDPRLTTRDPVDAETFADRLGAALLAETPPPDLERARALARDVDGASEIRPMTLRGVPAPGAPSLLRFAILLDREAD